MSVSTVQTKCKCGQTFDSHNSLGSDHGLCQDCWEAYCADAFWKFIGQNADALNAINTTTEMEQIYD